MTEDRLQAFSSKHIDIWGRLVSHVYCGAVLTSFSVQRLPDGSQLLRFEWQDEKRLEVVIRRGEW